MEKRIPKRRGPVCIEKCLIKSITGVLIGDDDDVDNESGTLKFRNNFYSFSLWTVVEASLKCRRERTIDHHAFTFFNKP